MTDIRHVPDPAVTAYDAVTRRRSIRSFLPTPVPSDVTERILTAAARAASGQNMQPWAIHVVTGGTRAWLCQVVSDAVRAEERSDEYPYFPEELRDPYRARRRKVGFDLYDIYGIGREDIAGRQAALLRNFEFFGAPVGLFFTMERDMGLGAWIDMGNIMTNVMTLAPAFGLATCPQQAWAEYGAAVRRVLPIAGNHLIVSGMALGVADTAAAVNRLVTERAAPQEFIRLHD